MSKLFDVRDYGAVGDGRAIDTEAIHRAFEACAAAGGGQVRLSPGEYLSGTVRLQSGVTLYLDAGAVLRGTDDLDAYESYEPAGKPSRWHRALILADGVECAGVTGPGVIDGARVHDPKGEEKMRGPHTIILARSRGVFVRDVTIIDSANYAVFPICCDDVDVHNVTVQGGWDGFHIRGTEERWCHRVTVTGCRFFTGDDAVAGTWVRDLLVRDCVLNSSCNGVRWIGPAERMIIDDCLIYGPGRHPHRTQDRHNALIGITLQPGAWDRMPGPLDQVRISNVTMHHVKCPFMFFVKPGSRGGRVEVNRATATGVYEAACSVESWVNEPFDEVIFRDVDIAYAFDPDAAPAGDEVAEPKHGSRPLPAWGLYARNVRRLVLDDVRLTADKPDPRATIRLDDVAEVETDNLRLPSWAKPVDLDRP